jgi:hypothetical protein
VSRYHRTVLSPAVLTGAVPNSLKEFFIAVLRHYLPFVRLTRPITALVVDLCRHLVLVGLGGSGSALVLAFGSRDNCSINRAVSASDLTFFTFMIFSFF